MLAALPLLLTASGGFRLPVPCRHAPIAAVMTSEASEQPEPEWAEFEAWINRKDDAEPEEDGDRPQWKITSAGHQHDHFFAKGRAFADVGAPERMVSNLAKLGVLQPSEVQACAYPHLVAGEDCIVQYPNGMGKTLSYVAPIIDRLWRAEAEHGRTPPRQVRAIIVVPTAELGQQVLALARDVASRSIRATLATGEHSWQTQRERLGGGIDLLVATMGRLVAHVEPRGGKEPSCTLEGTIMLVVDEADSLYDGEAPSWLQKRTGSQGMKQTPPVAMWRWLRLRLPTACSTTLVTASLSSDLEAQMRQDVGGELRTLRGRGVHTTRPGVPITLVDCSRPGLAEDGRLSLFEGKLDELLTALNEPTHGEGGGEGSSEGSGRPSSARTLVITNTASTCDRLARALHARLDRSVRVLRFHSSLTGAQRAESLDAFSAATAGAASRGPSKGADDEPAPPCVLVATGRAIKGLGFHSGGPKGAAGDTAGVGHVVLFDFPPDANAYIARVGFATRGDTPSARVTALALGKQVAFAKAMLANDEAGRPHELD